MIVKRYCNVVDPDGLCVWYDRALNFSPRSRSWRWPLGVCLSAVLAGEKPLLYRFAPSSLEGCGLVVRDIGTGVAFLPENEDIADLLCWAYKDQYLPKQLRDFVIGVCCGYPVRSVLSFCRLRCVPGCSSLLLRRL